MNRLELVERVPEAKDNKNHSIIMLEILREDC